VTRQERDPGSAQPRVPSKTSRQLAVRQPHSNADEVTSPTPCPTVTGIVEVDLADVGYGLGLAGAEVVRVRLGAGLWVDHTALTSLAAATFDSVRRVEVVGDDRRAVADAVDTVRRLHARYQRDAAEYEELDDWPQFGPKDPAPTGAEIAQLMGSKASRAEAVTPVRCTSPGCKTTVPVSHPLPSSLESIRCDSHRRVSE
jgi:hypothetical protein